MKFDFDWPMQQFQRRRRLNIVDDYDDNDRAWVYYKLTFGSGEQKNQLKCLNIFCTIYVLDQT